MSDPAGDRAENEKALDRIVLFSDAIFAIVMTLLVLEIPVPEIPPDLVSKELPLRVFELWPKIFSYVLSFLVVGTYWIAHHGTFRYIQSYDRGLMWLNLLFLLSISFVPFPTALLGEYGDEQFSVVVYAASLAVARLLLALVWWHALRGRVALSENLDRGLARYHLARSLAIPFVFVLSIGISFISVDAAILSWFLLLAVDAVLWRLQRRYRWF